MFLSPGDSWQDPVLGNFELTFASIVSGDSEIELDVSGDDMTLRFENVDGREIVLPFFCEAPECICLHILWYSLLNPNLFKLKTKYSL